MMKKVFKRQDEQFLNLLRLVTVFCIRFEKIINIIPQIRLITIIRIVIII